MEDQSSPQQKISENYPKLDSNWIRVIIFSVIIMWIFGGALSRIVDTAFAHLLEQIDPFFILYAILLITIIIIVFWIMCCMIRVNFEYQNSVIFRLGRLHRIKKAGLYFILPVIEQETKIDLRIITVDIESQDTVTKDSVTIGVNAVLYYRIVNPAQAIIRVKDYHFATSQVALTTLRNVIGQHQLDELLQKRDEINIRICEIVDEITDSWGIEIERIEIKNLEIPKGMQRAMAKEAEAMREKRSRLIKAESEYESTMKLKQAAQEIAESPVALELRRMQMIAEIGTEQNTTTLLMIPSYILSAAKELTQFMSSHNSKQ